MKKVTILFSLLIAFFIAMPAVAQSPEDMMMQQLPIDKDVRF